MAETKKAHERRLKEGWFDNYITGKVIDIGVGRIDTHDGADPVTPDCDTWDKDNGDAHDMHGVENEAYDTVYCSHLIEHLEDPVRAIRSWWRILKPGGYLIIVAPDRDSYERKTTLPSKWNADHKFFLTANRSYPPHTFSLFGIIESAIRGYKIELMRTINTCTNMDKPEEHGDGEYSIEVIIKKL